MFSLFIVLLCLTESSHQQGLPSDFPGKITCYDFEGTPYNNNTQCSGSFVCCQTPDECNPNRLCDGPHGSLIRPTCSQYPWTNCSPLCLFEEHNGFLPRVNQCEDGSFCCDKDPGCCNNNTGVVLNGSGEVVSTNSPTSSMTSTSSATVASSSQTSSTNTPSSTTQSPTGIAAPISTQIPGSTSYASATSSSSSSGLSTGGIVGIAIGASLSLLLVGAASIMFILHRKKIRRLEAVVAEHNEARTQPFYHGTSHGSKAHFHPGASAETHEPTKWNTTPEIAELRGRGMHDVVSELPALR